MNWPCFGAWNGDERGLFDLFVVNILPALYPAALLFGRGVGLLLLLLLIVLQLLGGCAGAKKERSDFIKDVHQESDNKQKFVHKPFWVKRINRETKV
jgi:hypothetical protein